ncbi:MAG: OadG family protein [Melioribacteraceae bacterium]|jgi:Na+-transporting methylmalonyl-CoA/oxaloacetate decarboxylase gamma subunit|nr:OadG family protein [Melioribacteraceae bacterium]
MNLAIIAQVTAQVDSVTSSKMHQNAEKFTQVDPIGIGITFVGMAVVFFSLLLLYLVFINITKLLNQKLKRSIKREGQTVEIKVNEEELSGEVNAAIAMAIHLYMSEIHDQENMVLTINRVARTYSPWSSKIYGIRQFPR